MVLVDGGGIPTFGKNRSSQLDIGEDVVSPYLWDRSIRQIDVLVCSHAHEDHIGGLPALMRNFHVKELWTGATPESPQWDALRKTALAGGVRIVPMQCGRRFTFGGADFEALAPAPDYVPGPSPRNNDSLVLRVAFGKNAFFLSGDIERQVEAELVSEGRVHHVDVLKVAHHGSRTSTIPEFLDAARPEFAVISAGAGNFYGHPHRDVVDRLQARHVDLFRTDQDGLVSIVSDGYRLRVKTWGWEEARSPSAALSLAF